MRSCPPSDDQPVELHGPGLAVDAGGGFGDELGRNVADGYHVLPPVVHAEETLGQRGEHAVQLPVGHRGVRAQGRHDIDEPIAEILVGHRAKRPGHAVGPREVGRQGQHLPPRFQASQGLEQCLAKVSAS